MALASLKQYQMISDLAWSAAGKIEAESRNVEPNLRRLVLLSNMYDELALKVGATPFPQQDDFLPSTAEEPLAATNNSESELFSSTSSVDEYPSSSEGSDEWDSDDSGCSDTEAPPPYSMYTSPCVIVSVNECCDDDSDDDPLCHPLAEDFGSPLCKVLSANHHFTSIEGDFKRSPSTEPGNVGVPEEEVNGGHVQSWQSRSDNGIAALLGIHKAERTHVSSVNRGSRQLVGSKSEKSMTCRLLHAFRSVIA
jgi:hypothetical protein